jgi:hypothetical protein
VRRVDLADGSMRPAHGSRPTWPRATPSAASARCSRPTPRVRAYSNPPRRIPMICAIGGSAISVQSDVGSSADRHVPMKIHTKHRSGATQ